LCSLRQKSHITRAARPWSSTAITVCTRVALQARHRSSIDWPARCGRLALASK
jgi:hypothetical protein